MLTERKRFNYMANTSHFNSSSQKKQVGSIVKPTTTVFHEDYGMPKVHD